jgi:hypothetical protein
VCVDCRDTGQVSTEDKWVKIRLYERPNFYNNDDVHSTYSTTQ